MSLSQWTFGTCIAFLKALKARLFANKDRSFVTRMRPFSISSRHSPWRKGVCTEKPRLDAFNTSTAYSMGIFKGFGILYFRIKRSPQQ